MLRKKLLVMVAAMLVFAAGRAAAEIQSSTQNVTITVTPVVTANFTISPDLISLGNVDVGESTGNVTALTIANQGNVDLKFEKTVWDITSAGDPWTMGTPGNNVFRLSAVAQASVPDNWDVVGSSAVFITTKEEYNDLTDESDDQLVLAPTGESGASENLWFNLEMPTSVGHTQQQTITVRIKGLSD